MEGMTRAVYHWIGFTIMAHVDARTKGRPKIKSLIYIIPPHKCQKLFSQNIILAINVAIIIEENMV